MKSNEIVRETIINRPSHTPFNGPILKEEISFAEISRRINTIPGELRCPHNLMIMEEVIKND